jgi:4-hydroxy-tetrahydrodipicolinate synthase
MILYNVPSRTGQDVPLAVIVELARVENIVGIKEASGSIDKVSQIIESTVDEDFVVLSGDDGLTLPILSVGGRGVISVAANIVPDRMSKMVNAALAGDYETARKFHYEIAPLIRALFLETNPIPVKKAAELIGLASGHVRLPLAPLSESNTEKLADELRKLGVME